MEHPDFDTLLRYVSAVAPDDECVRLDAHLANCAACLEQVQLLDSLRETFGSPGENWTLPQLKAECQRINWDQAGLPVKGEQASAPAGKAALGESDGASADAPALSRGAKLETPSSLRGQSTPTALRQAAEHWLQEVRGFFSNLSPRPALVTFALTAVLLLALVLWWPFRDAGPVKVQVADLDGPVRLTARDRLFLPEGIKLPAPWCTRVQELLASGKVAPVASVAAIGNQVRTEFARLSSAESATNRPALLAPVATSILATRPTFRWRGTRGATGYRVLLVHEGKVIWEADAEGRTELTLSGDSPVLRPGEFYSWQVEARVNGELRSPTPAKFHVLDTASATEVRRLEQQFGRSATVMASVYLAYGLLDEAQAPMEKLRELNPGNEAVARMWENLASHRTTQ
jgi:hypothetical protein